MKSTNAMLLGMLFAYAGVQANETLVLGADCQMTPQVVLDQVTYCNVTAIDMNGTGAASLYPSAIPVSGVGGVISDVRVRLQNVTHPNTSGVRAILQPPSGPAIGLTGAYTSIGSGPLPVASSDQWVFSDQAVDYAVFFRFDDPVTKSTAPVSGTYLPRTFRLPDLPAPAPTGLHSQLLSSQIGRTANGNWRLFVAQSAIGTVSGTIAGGWCLDITTTAASTGCYASTTLSGAITASDPTQTGSVNRNGEPALCNWPKSNSLSGSSVLHYDAYPLLNGAGQESCITATADYSGCAAENTHMVVYSIYDPANPADNVLAEAGTSSGDLDNRVQTSFKRDPGAPFTVVVHEMAAGLGCPNYSVILERNPCSGAPRGDVIFRNGFD